MNYQNVRSVKKKTHIKKRSLNPVFNESFIFDLPSKEGSLDDIQLEVVMCDWDRITKNEVSQRSSVGVSPETSNPVCVIRFNSNKLILIKSKPKQYLIRTPLYIQF